jgi:aspartyl/asparaginyl-tRNA synthetase
MLRGSTLLTPFLRIPYTEAIQLLQDSGEEFRIEPKVFCSSSASAVSHSIISFHVINPPSLPPPVPPYPVGV